MPHLSISLLGPLQVLRDGEPVTSFPTDKERALLAYLVAEADKPHRREDLAGLLWGGLPDETALNNLRRSLHRLRRTLGDDEAPMPFLVVAPRTLQFNLASDHAVDTNDFLERWNRVGAHPHRRAETCETCRGWRETAATLYRGDFLQGFSLPDSVEFDEWLAVRREQFRLSGLDIFEQLADQYLRRGDYERARPFALHQIEMEPWRETAHRQLMTALARSGQRAAALAQYDACRRVVANELGADPEEATTTLYQRIKAGQYHERSDSEPAPHRSLPHSPTPFFGREAELARLRDRLLDPAERLITLVGEGGVGKTRLAIKATEAVQHDFAEGAWFVPLAGLAVHQTDRGPEAVLQAIASALNFTALGSGDFKTQLFNYLRAKECLLLLDNMEHLTGGAQVVLELLEAAPRVVVLVTSREPLDVPSEHLIRLDGLPVPQAEAGAVHFSSVQLFAERAERASGIFGLAEADLAPVLHICRLVNGSPLGIELAAAAVRLQSPQQIAAAIQSNIDTLSATLRDLPPRHRSMRAAFEGSWQLLNPSERRALARASVFRGGFTAEAAGEVAGASLPELLSLVDKSLVRQSESGRFDLHELWRQIASDKLEAQAETSTRHSHFFLRYAGAQVPHLNGAQPRAALIEMQGEADNIREAWRWAVANRQPEALSVGLQGLTDFYDLSGGIQEAVRELQAAIAELASGDPLQCDLPLRLLVARLYAELSRFHNLHYLVEPTIEAARQSVQWAQAANAPQVEALADLYWGVAHWRQAAVPEARSRIEIALTIAREQQNADLEAEAYRALGFVADRLGQYDEARQYQLQARELFNQLGDAQGECRVTASLGNVAWSQGDLMNAMVHYTQSLGLARQTGNRFDETDAQHNLGSTWNSLGDYDQALRHFQLSIEAGEAIGLPDYVLGITYINLALTQYHLGDCEAARQGCNRVLELARTMSMRREEGLALTLLGHALAGLARLEEAEDAYQRALAVERDLQQHNLAMEPLAGLARVALAQGDAKRALRYTEAILTHLEAGTLHGTDEPFRVWWTCYDVLRANADPRAPEVLRRASGLLQAQAQKISDEAMRQNFLERIPEHRAIAGAVAAQV